MTVVSPSRIGFPSLSLAIFVKTSRSGSTTSRYTPPHGCSVPSGERITICQEPPTRASASQTGFVNPFGPNHFARCLGSVHALNTSSRGASKIRVMVISLSLDDATLLMKFLQRAVQADRDTQRSQRDYFLRAYFFSFFFNSLK